MHTVYRVVKQVKRYAQNKKVECLLIRDTPVSACITFQWRYGNYGQTYSINKFEVAELNEEFIPFFIGFLCGYADDVIQASNN